MAGLTAREKDARIYWRIMQEGLRDTTITEFQGELEDLSAMTASPVVKDLCARNLHRFDGPYNVLRAVASK